MTERQQSGPEVALCAAGFSVPSDKHTDRNEDAYFASSEARAIGAFDGVGGAYGSAAASKLAAQTVLERMRELPNNLPRELGRNAVREALVLADEVIAAQTTREIGTTAAVVKVFEENSSPYAAVAHIADSRAYLMRDGKLRQLTLDNAQSADKYPDEGERLAAEAEAWRMQDILSAIDDSDQLEKDLEIKKAFRYRNLINSCLGPYTDDAVIHVSDVDVQAGDKLIVTSDGIHDNLTATEIAEVINQHESVNAIAMALVRAAHERSRDRDHLRSKADDITAAVMTV